MTVTTRDATPGDAPAMTMMLNEIIKAGGTTAFEEPFSEDQVVSGFIDAEDGITCIIAEIDGQVVGFQFLTWPYEGGRDFPAGWTVIATFVKPELTGAGIGAALFLDTEMVAANSGVEVIDATIRGDNTGGLRYYSKMGFTDYRVEPGVPLANGTPVDRISKRFDLGTTVKS